MLRCLSLLTLAVATFLTSDAVPAAKVGSDRFQFNRDIRIASNETVGDVTCLNCSVRVAGHVSGDVVTLHGNIIAEQGASIAGDAVAIGGHTRLGNGVQVAGDLVAIGGSAYRDPQATVGGDVTAVESAAWPVLILLLPLVFIGGLVALIIWMVRRNRQRAAVPAYTVRPT